MHVRILGSAAGGGVPQWNCRCPNCAAARAGSPDVRPRTQSSVAVSADGRAWFLLNVSPDIRQQILAFPALGPPPSPPTPLPERERGERGRGSAIAGCVLTDAELDHTAGLLLLREGCTFGIASTPVVRRWLHEDFPVGRVLAHFAERPWSDLPLDTPFQLQSPAKGPVGLRVYAFETARHVPRFVSEDPAEAVGAVVGLVVEDAATGGRLVYAPCVASLSEPLLAAAKGADCILMDGTFWSDDELIRMGIGDRTTREMGHLPVDGPEGSLAWLGQLAARHRVYVHVNNTNPMLPLGSPERRIVEESGVRVGADSDEFLL